VVGGTGASPVVGVLVGTGGILEGQAFVVRDGENRIGRLTGIEVALPQTDDRISRQHAVLIHREGAFGIKALRPENPTWVNGEVVREGAALSDGDEIRVGQSTFRFRVT